MGGSGREGDFDHLLDPHCSEILQLLFSVMRRKLDLVKAVR